VDLLRTSGPFVKDTVAFEMKILQNPARAKEIRDYFQLEKLYDADADTWTKALAIGKYVAANIPHDNQEIEPEHRNAIDLWEYTKKYRTRVQLPVAQSPYLRTPACRWTGRSVYHLYAGR
jgi:hypothetical protein